LSREFAREHSERLWKQLVLPSDVVQESATNPRTEAGVVLGLAVCAAAAIKIPALFGLKFGSSDPFYARNASLFVFPLISAYLAWMCGLKVFAMFWRALAFGVGAFMGNVFSFGPGSHASVLTGLHLPIARWLAVGFAYVGGSWFSDGGRMHFVRFSGELAIY